MNPGRLAQGGFMREVAGKSVTAMPFPGVDHRGGAGWIRVYAQQHHFAEWQRLGYRETGTVSRYPSPNKVVC
jgi:hypothetical protein